MTKLSDATPAEWDKASKTVYGRLHHPQDSVKKPAHYTNGGVEAIDYIKQQVEDFESYLEGNVHKYLHRYKLKGKPIEDLNKARVYLDWLIEEVSNGR